MHPVLFKIGSIPIHTYGAMIALGFILAMQVIRKLAERSQLPVERVLDLCFWNLIMGLLGARVLFVITRWEYFSSDPLAMLKIWEGGLVFFGGLIASLLFSVWYVRKHRLSFWRTFDALMPGLTLGHMFGRFGCIGAGCCYGKPTGTDFGLKLHSDLVDPHLRGIPLHPTQIYEAGGLFFLFLALLWVFKNRRFDGQVGLTYLLVYPILRSVVEVFRGDLIRGFVIDNILSTSQFLSILIFLAALVMLYLRGKNLKASSG